jgi:hypothetical protein
MELVFGVHDFKVDGNQNIDLQKNRQTFYNRMVEGIVTAICT